MMFPWNIIEDDPCRFRTLFGTVFFQSRMFHVEHEFDTYVLHQRMLKI